METMSYLEMGEELIMEILNDIVMDTEDVEEIFDIFFCLTEDEGITLDGMTEGDEILFAGMIENIYIKTALQLKKIRQNNLVD